MVGYQLFHLQLLMYTSWNSQCKSYFTFSLTTGITKKSLNIARKKKKNNDKIFMLAKSKLNRIENLISQALIDMDISHEKFITILKEKINMKR